MTATFNGTWAEISDIQTTKILRAFKPGDIVFVEFPAPISAENAERIHQRFAEICPEIKIVLLGDGLKVVAREEVTEATAGAASGASREFSEGGPLPKGKTYRVNEEGDVPESVAQLKEGLTKTLVKTIIDGPRPTGGPPAPRPA